MIFSKVFKSNPIQSFELTVASGTGNNMVAFGPASIINGSVKLFLDKTIQAKSIRVVFSCHEWDQQQEPTKLLSVESDIWSQNAESDLLERGSHIYLFAIQLPSSVNYPPTIRDSYLGHRIEYTLQGHLDFTLDNSTHKHKSTASVPLTYLPLVTFDDRMNQYATRNKSIKIEQGDEYVHVTASLANPSSCPGDLCSIKLYTHNKSSYSINQVHIVLLSTATSLNDNRHPDLPVSSGPSYQHKQRQILNESFYVSIPKHTSDITTICPFRVPSFCVPTTQSHFGKYIDITYEVFIIIPAMGSNWDGCATSQLLLNTQAIRLPLFVTTVPYCSTQPPKLQIPFADESNSDVPNFIINESPIPSPVTDGWEPGSPVDPDDELCLPQTHEDASGHLMVPPIVSPSTSVRRSLSVHSTTSSAA
ncbi:unnamed protein product [Mucor circinelloides]|uniref:Arrestin C-terminal-like domain-containing protein n=1 Tax=Mucor circinelloides f. circinelloides (strain 1006PhL) TaxID=1220926 RepID=S2JBK5_MUCC1|nr:hypothetical protein HMPREF1544_06050 [Mucor circinelloides 1006PhL]